MENIKLKVMRKKVDEYKKLILETFRGTAGFTLNEIAEAIGLPEEDRELFNQATAELKKIKILPHLVFKTNKSLLFQ